MGYLDVLVESDVLQEVLYEKGGSERHSFSQPELQVWRLVDSAPQLLPSIRDQLPYRAYRHPAKSPTAVSASSLLTAINLIMIRTSILRRLRLSHPAKIVLAFLGLALFLLLPSYRPSPTFDIDQLDKATASELESQYEKTRRSVLDKKRFQAVDAARHIRAPLTLPTGGDTFDPGVEIYVKRLRLFIEEYLLRSPSHHLELGAAVEDVAHHRSRSSDLPRKIWSTNRHGLSGADDSFGLWSRLLPLPLSPKLATHLPPRSVPGGEWELNVADDDEADRLMSKWTGETLSRGTPGRGGKFGDMWGKLELGVLRADVFRSVSLAGER